MALARQLDGTGCCVCKCQMLDTICTPTLICCSLYTAGALTGFDASGHVAEETRHAKHVLSPLLLVLQLTLNCSVIAARGVITSVAVTGAIGFPTIILLLFCTPDLGTLFSLGAPQPFVQIYAMALGKGPAVFMTAIAVIGATLVNAFIALPFHD